MLPCQEVDEPPGLAEEPPVVTPAADNTTLLQNDEESFALAPVDATVLKGTLVLTSTRKQFPVNTDLPLSLCMANHFIP